MRRHASVLAALCLTVVATAPGRADDPSVARAIIEKAVKAAGGGARLTRFKAGVYKSKGVLYGRGAGDLSYTQETAVQFPWQCRMALASDILKKTIVLNGDKGWIREDGATEELTGDDLASQQELLYAAWVATLAPLTDKAFTLAALGDSKVGGRAAEGVKVTHKGRPEVRLYFDKEGGLLLKMERLMRSAISGEEMSQEVLFSNFKEIDGIQEAMKYTFKLDGKLAAEEEVLELKHQEKLDDKVFARP
jgi:hypothetical protein